MGILSRGVENGDRLKKKKRNAWSNTLTWKQSAKETDGEAINLLSLCKKCRTRLIASLFRSTSPQDITRK